jgi:hypothetical protein
MGPAFSQERMPQGQRIWEVMLGIVLFRRDEALRGGFGLASPAQQLRLISLRRQQWTLDGIEGIDKDSGKGGSVKYLECLLCCLSVGRGFHPLGEWEVTCQPSASRSCSCRVLRSQRVCEFSYAQWYGSGVLQYRFISYIFRLALRTARPLNGGNRMLEQGKDSA